MLEVIHASMILCIYIIFMIVSLMMIFSLCSSSRQCSPGEEVKQKQDQMEYADNALAIVPVNMWPESKNKESQINNITDVLIALRRAKEHLQSSIGIRSSACSKSVRMSGMYRDVLLPD